MDDAPREAADPRERLRKQMAGLADFGLSAFEAEDIDRLLHEAAALVSEALDVDLVKIMEWRPEQEDFLVRAGVNWQPGIVGGAALPGDSKSPAGFAFRSHEPVISPDVASEERFEIPELLIEHGVKSMANVIIVGNREPFGVLEVDSPGQRRFDDDDVAFLRNYANLIAAAVDRLRAHKALEELAEERGVLVRELQHRVKNVLTLVQSFARLTKTEERTAEAFREALIGRLDALARAHALFSERDGDVDLRHLVERVLEPYAIDGSEAVEIVGERVRLDAKQGVTLGLTLHELATNAAKHGALSAKGGRVHVSWQVERGEAASRLELRWRESGGPRIEPRRRQGFGTTLIERVCGHELDGEAKLVFPPEGVRCEVSFPLRW